MKRLASNFIAIIASDIGRRVLGFLTIAFLARTITTSDFGAINIGFAVLSYALVSSAGGLGAFGAREVARGATAQLVNSVVSLRIVAALIVYLAVCLLAIICIPDTMVATLVMIFCISLFTYALSLEWFFQGKEEMGIIGISRFTSALIYLVLILALVRGSKDLWLVAAAAVAGDAVASVILLRSFRKRNRGFEHRFSIAGWRTYLAQSFPLGAGSMLAQFNMNLPTLVIGILLSNADVGLYSAASKMVVFLLVFDRVFGTLLLPASSRLHSYSPDFLSAKLNSALRWVLILALPLSLGGTLLADRLIPLAFGPQYQSSVAVFQVLIWYLLFTMIHTIYTSSAIAAGKEREYGFVMAASAVMNCVSVILFTKFFGIVGAAGAVVCSEAVTLLLMWKAIRASVRTSLPHSFPSIIGAAVLMAVLLTILPATHLILSVLAGGGIYAAVLLITRAVTIADLAALVKRV